MERVENRSEYHDVAARSLISIVNMISSKEETAAAKLCIFNIRQAYIIYRLDDEENRKEVGKKFKEEKEKSANKGKAIDVDTILSQELDDMKLDKLDLPQLLNKMFTYQTLAGIKPVQTFRQSARMFTKSRSELGFR